jgi:hypothetical protein
MAEEFKRAMPDQRNHQSPKAQHPNEASAEFTSTPALRHVGPTLESEPGYFDRSRPEGLNSGYSTPEAQIAAEGDSTQVFQGESGETDLAANLQGGYKSSLTHSRTATGPEPLKTRLPGDTSSDPHTDLGPDNATTVQKRGESR